MYALATYYSSVLNVTTHTRNNKGQALENRQANSFRKNQAHKKPAQYQKQEKEFSFTPVSFYNDLCPGTLPYY